MNCWIAGIFRSGVTGLATTRTHPCWVVFARGFPGLCDFPMLKSSGRHSRRRVPVPFPAFPAGSSGFYSGKCLISRCCQDEYTLTSTDYIFSHIYRCLVGNVRNQLFRRNAADLAALISTAWIMSNPINCVPKRNVNSAENGRL